MRKLLGKLSIAAAQWIVRYAKRKGYDFRLPSDPTLFSERIGLRTTVFSLAGFRLLRPCPMDTDSDGDCHRCHRHGGCANHLAE